DILAEVVIEVRAVKIDGCRHCGIAPLLMQSRRRAKNGAGAYCKPSGREMLISADGAFAASGSNATARPCHRPRYLPAHASGIQLQITSNPRLPRYRMALRSGVSAALFIVSRWRARTSSAARAWRRFVTRIAGSATKKPPGCETGRARGREAQMLMNRSVSGVPVQSRPGARERVLLHQFSAPNPSFSHAPPYLPVLLVARTFCHVLTLSGVSHKYL